ncbi:nucleotidyltransferase domain-containing protein, partial [Paractinoplanes rishiriensis]|uniref:nucleotidyltransferase domain-containing protein n=1 Tax=Paractinoplanes rishiriensis TaxID=1050105 RepID=UPI001942D4E1
MTDDVGVLQFPPGLASERCGLLTELARRNETEHGENLLGLVLSGSAGRGMATSRSDLDVIVVLTDTGGQGSETSRSAA